MDVKEGLTQQPHQTNHYVWPVATWVDLNEKALLLIERNENRPDFRGFHRYQTLFVCRNDALAKYMVDMGPAELYLAAEFDIPGGDPGQPMGEWYESVASLMDHADIFREWLGHRKYEREMPDLIQGFHDMVDKEHLERRRISQFGPKYRIARG